MFLHIYFRMWQFPLISHIPPVICEINHLTPFSFLTLDPKSSEWYGQLLCHSNTQIKRKCQSNKRLKVQMRSAKENILRPWVHRCGGKGCSPFAFIDPSHQLLLPKLLPNRSPSSCNWYEFVTYESGMIKSPLPSFR